MLKRAVTIIVLALLVATLLTSCNPESTSSTNLPPDESETPATSDTETPTAADSEESPSSSPETTSNLTMLSITEGDVFVLKASAADWIEAEVGMTLEVGDVIRSGEDSSAKITFFDGSTIELLANTQIEVAALELSDSGSKTIVLEQEIGSTISRVTELVDSASRYEVETPAGVAAVRGSSMLLKVTLDGTTYITNRQGHIWFISQDGVAVRVPEGLKFKIIPGQSAELEWGGDSGGDGGNEPNNPPVAADDSATTAPATPVTIDVLANDSDPDGDDPIVYSATQGANGTVVNNGTDVTYTPDYEFIGTDTFTYTISDGNGGFDTATVTVNVATVANINIQVDPAMGASIYIWDDTDDDWAIDEDTENPINGENHTTPDNITVAAGHCYYVWVEKDGYTFSVNNYPNDWVITTDPSENNEAAYGCTSADSQYQVHFTSSETSEQTVRFPEEGNAYIGYEDATGADFDYNDFGMYMFIEEVYVDDCLTEINMEFWSVVKRSGGSHAIHILRTLSEGTGYNYTITRTYTAQGEETPAVTNAVGQGDFDIVLFDSDYFASNIVTIHIEVTSGCEPYGSEVPPPRWDLDSIWINYDPYMDYRTMYVERHIDDWEPAESPLPTTGYDVPYILVVPVDGWLPPAEGQVITAPYPDFDDYYNTGSPENWYESET